LEIPLTAKEWSNQQTLEHLDLTKGPGLPWKYMGFKTREQLFESNAWQINYENIDFLKKILPLYESVGKEELASIDDYYDKKSRTFQTTGAHLLYWQLRLYGEGNEQLKMFKWSKYGFNPFYGGVDKWYRTLTVLDKDGKIKYQVRINWDISGYDRKVLLHYVADRRYRFWKNANPQSNYDKIAQWVRNAWKRSIIVFHNGDIVIRLRGNNSGSGTTTANNIEAGFEIVADLLVYTYFMKYGEIPPEELVIQQLINLYGDDNSMFLLECFSLMLDDKLVKDRLLHQHGLVCKWIVGGIEFPFDKLPFLGFTCEPYKEFFIPKWEIKRLLHPILYTPCRKTIGQYLQQFYALTVMSFAYQDIFFRLRHIYVQLLQHFSLSGAPDVKVMLKLGVPTHREVEAFYLGFEGSEAVSMQYVTGGGGPLIRHEMSAMNGAILTYAARRNNDDSYESKGLSPDEYLKRNSEKFPLAPHLRDLLWNEDQPIQKRQRKQDDARVASALKIGSYNQYGNEQMTHQISKRNLINEIASAKIPIKKLHVSEDEEEEKKIEDTNPYALMRDITAQHMKTPFRSVSVYSPTYKQLNDGSWEIYSTVLVDGRAPQTVFGYGSTSMEAFEDWKTKLDEIFEEWAPTPKRERQLKLFALIQTLPRPEEHHPLSFMWAEDGLLRYMDLLKLCGDIESNPGPLSKGQYLSQNKALFDKQKLTPQQRNAKFSAYLSKEKSLPMNNKRNMQPAKITPKVNPKPKNFTVKNFPMGRADKQHASIQSSFSECARVYGAALSCPFAWVDEECDNVIMGFKLKEKIGPCVPSDPPRKTQKSYAFIRTTLKTSAAGGSPGGAFVVMAPDRIANDYPNDMRSPPLVFSSGGYGTATPEPSFDANLDLPIAPPVGVGTANFNTQFSSTDVLFVNNSDIMNYRVVAGGFRVRYIGPEISRAGMYHFITTPGHTTLAGVTLTQAGKFETFYEQVVTREWVYILYSPTLTSEYALQPDYPYNAFLVPDSVNVDKQQHYLGLLISDTAPLSSFELQAICHFEVEGPKVRGLTDTKADPVGAAAMVNTFTPQNMPRVVESKDPAKLVKEESSSLSNMIEIGKMLLPLVL